MFVLFDQGTPVPIAKALSGHSVRTAREMGWATITNGELLRAAEAAGFDVLLTTDKNLAHQQNLTNRKPAIIALCKNRWSLLKPMLPQIASAVNHARPGDYVIVDVPENQIGNRRV